MSPAKDYADDKVIVHENGPPLPGEFAETYWKPPEDMSFGQWMRAGTILRTLNRSLMWALGDWINFGERRYGEKYSQAIDATDYDYDTCYRASMVAKIFAPDQRRAALSWGHHREVTDIAEPSERSQVLSHAEGEGLSVHGLRQYRRQQKGRSGLSVEASDLLRKASKEAGRLVERGRDNVWLDHVHVGEGTLRVSVAYEADVSGV